MLQRIVFLLVFTRESVKKKCGILLVLLINFLVNMVNNYKNKKISVVVPCFNEEENIQEMNKRLKKVFSSIENPYEIIFINNGSTDSSKEIFKSLVKKDKNVIIISYSRDF